jgi:hypothetical protein
MDHTIPSMPDARVAATGDPDSPRAAERRVFDEAVEDVARGLTDSAALRATRAELDRLRAGVRPPRMSSMAGPRLIGVVAPLAIAAVWSMSGGWILAAVVAALIVVYEVTRHVRVRRHRVYRMGACRSCGYAMAGLPDAIDPALLGCRRVGPATCPECGTRWPRQPPE